VKLKDTNTSCTSRLLDSFCLLLQLATLSARSISTVPMTGHAPEYKSGPQSLRVYRINQVISCLLPCVRTGRYQKSSSMFQKRPSCLLLRIVPGNNYFCPLDVPPLEAKNEVPRMHAGRMNGRWQPCSLVQRKDLASLLHTRIYLGCTVCGREIFGCRLQVVHYSWTPSWHRRRKKVPSNTKWNLLCNSCRSECVEK
jgi:hypothetical protein